MSNDYYVYIHRDKEGNPFYVGKGKGDRAKVTKDRDDDWHKIAIRGYTIEIVAQNLSSEDALDREECFIHGFGRLSDGRGPLVNCVEVGGKTKAKRETALPESEKIKKIIHRTGLPPPQLCKPIKVTINKKWEVTAKTWLEKKEFDIFRKLLKPYGNYRPVIKKTVLFDLPGFICAANTYNWEVELGEDLNMDKPA